MTARRSGVAKRNRSKGPTGKQTHLIKELRREVGEPRGAMPNTRMEACREIDRLLALKRAAEPRDIVQVARARPVPQQPRPVRHLTDDEIERRQALLREEQNRLKAEAAARRERRATG